jgi:hypothetical protein
MSNEGPINWDALVANLMSGYLGYVAGSRKFAGWEPIINSYNARMSHLAYQKAIRPVSFFAAIPNSEIIYREAVWAYLFGLPDASIPTSLRCLEMGLTNKHTIETGQPPPENSKLFYLINWAEQYLGKRREIAHGFRLIRNLIHEPSILSEQDAIEAIRHITIILNLLYPILTPFVITNYACQNCKNPLHINVPLPNNYSGNIIKPNCPHCAQPTSVLII